MPQPNKEQPARNVRIVALRRETTLSATEIAAKLCEEGYPSTTKNVVIGILARHAPELMAKRHAPRPRQDFPPSGHCLFSKGRFVPYAWCGAPTPQGSPWCEEHRRVVFERAPGKIDLRGIR